jgi:hypothetical protein
MHLVTCRSRSGEPVVALLDGADVIALGDLVADAPAEMNLFLKLINLFF